MRGLTLRILLSIVAIIILVIGLLALQLRRPVEIPLGTPNGEMAYVSNRDGNWEIYVLDAAGSSRNVSNHPAGDYFPSWSFDSQRINFLTARGGAEIEPGQVEPDGANARTLSIFQAVTTVFFEGRLDWDAQWTADAVTWASVRDLNLEIYAQALGEGSTALRLTNDGARDWFPAWSPDGSRVAFSSDRAGNEDIYIVNRDGSGLTQLTTDAADDIRPIWSDDGTRILFISERVNALLDGVMDVYVMNADGSDQQPLSGDFDSAAMWSPDGSQAVWMSNRGGRWGLYLRDADCVDCVRRLTDDSANALFPAWRP